MRRAAKHKQALTACTAGGSSATAAAVPSPASLTAPLSCVHALPADDTAAAAAAAGYGPPCPALLPPQAFWVYVLCALNWLPSSALSRSAITYACWLILGYAAHELLEAQGGGYCRATAPGVAYSGGPKLTAHGHLHPGHGAAQAAPPPPTSRSEGVPYY